ncbi:MAG: iron-regulated protein [Verrucomicrobiaceae bacterium]|nr:MAG: iron-regulated protein [Verrucomicrobiaceae bacterium]
MKPPLFSLLAVPLTLALSPLQAATPEKDLKKQVVLNYGNIVHANYSDCVTAATELRDSIQAFLKKPSADSLAAARKVWIKARQPYLQSEAYRYYAGPIDDADGPEPLLNSWPLDEVYIDVAEGGDGGIIGNVKGYPQISPELIEELNLRDGEKNISCGWHAIEFLLWGQDKSVTGPGDRPFTDYTTAPNAKRRGEYLQACAELMIKHLTDVRDQWAPDQLGNYRNIFEEGYENSVERILTGMIFLSGNELAGERLQVAWDTQEQEDEHSCFSDTTHQDTIFDAIGLQNIYRGSYLQLNGQAVAGPGVRDLAKMAKADLVPLLDAKVDATVENAKKIPVPFDQAILGPIDGPGRKAIMATIAAAEDESALLRRLARALKIDIPEEAAGDVAG